MGRVLRNKLEKWLSENIKSRFLWSVVVVVGFLLFEKYFDFLFWHN